MSGPSERIATPSGALPPSASEGGSDTAPQPTPTMGDVTSGPTGAGGTGARPDSSQTPLAPSPDGAGGFAAGGSSFGTGGAASASPDAGAGPVRDETCELGVHDGSTPEVLPLSGDTFAHDPTMIEADGVFYRFWTGDYIPMASSNDLLNWRNGPSVYGRSYPAWSDEWRADNPGNTFNFPWAPDVSYFSGQFHLYSSFSAFFGRNISCITHLTTPDIASGEWTDHGPVVCTDGSQDYNAIDADVGVDTEGNPWLAFGSFWDGIQLFPLDQNGDRVGNELMQIAWAREIEAPVLFYRCGYYYLFVTWGLCCPGEGRSVSQLTYRVAVGRSEQITGPYVDRDGKLMTDGGGTVIVQGDGANFAAAGHSDVLVSGDQIYHLYHAYRAGSGAATLRIVELPFDDEGWPVPGGP